MAHIRLVCTTWKAVVAPQMWTTFIRDFQPSYNQNLGALIYPRSGILPHVRRLIVCKVSNLFLSDLETGLRRFLECMSRGSLKVFVGLSTLSPVIFKDLLIW